MPGASVFVRWGEADRPVPWGGRARFRHLPGTPLRPPRAPDARTVELMERITGNPDECGGRPCIRGMRIRVIDVLDLLAAGLSAAEVVAALHSRRGIDDAVVREHVEWARARHGSAATGNRIPEVPAGPL